MEIALKIDVDTHRGLGEGVPRLAAMLVREGRRRELLISRWDPTTRAAQSCARSENRGFLTKMLRTRAVSMYGTAHDAVRHAAAGAADRAGVSAELCAICARADSRSACMATITCAGRTISMTSARTASATSLSDAFEVVPRDPWRDVAQFRRAGMAHQRRGAASRSTRWVSPTAATRAACAVSMRRRGTVLAMSGDSDDAADARRE